MPRTVFVGRRAAYGLGGIRIAAEVNLSVVINPDMAVVGGAVVNIAASRPIIFPPEVNEAAVLNQADRGKRIGLADVCFRSVEVRAASVREQGRCPYHATGDRGGSLHHAGACIRRCVEDGPATGCNATMNKTVSRIEYRAAAGAVDRGANCR